MKDNYEATWTIKVRLAFDENDESVKWEYFDSANWRVKNDWNVDFDVSTFASSLSNLRSPRVNVDNNQSRRIILSNEKFIKYLAGDDNEYRIDPYQSLVFNYLLTSKKETAMVTLASIVRSHVTVQIRDLPEAHPCWFYNSSYKTGKINDYYFWSNIGQYMIPFPQLFFKKNSNPVEWLEREDIENSLDYLISHRIMHEILITDFVEEPDQKKCEITFSDKATLATYFRGKSCNCIPIPGKRSSRRRLETEEPFSVHSPEVVFTSPTTRKNLMQISDIWQDKFANSVLVSGPPGSGKENFALSIPYGNGRNPDSINTISLAVGDKQDQERIIFGTNNGDGLIAKSENGALFIDEVHYPHNDPGIRPGLLRALESKEYSPKDSNEIKKIENVMWIFSSSLALSGKTSLSSLRPQDFWTRMTHVLEIPHPLDPRFVDEVFRINTIKSLFRFFWWDRIETFFDKDPSLVFAEQPLQAVRRQDLSEIVLNERIKSLLNEDFLEKLSQLFCSEIVKSYTYSSGCFLELLSIRGIRSMVSRLFSIQVEEILTKQGKINFDKFEQVLPRVIAEIRQIATLTNQNTTH